ncbi:NAD-dependent epimerase/dehydratase family protein [Sandaracinobacteroides sayramensis]|uniref:NAD-dependent epimerase/dehydratase family protein n=1 Tax=Sandaracinobacteroides sayramensis TaxID=2913411 RepID=UPI001EDC396B|nr:NAD(P)-dependent oxidoreductase [Sandaracinobacteroides sayramensis]
MARYLLTGGAGFIGSHLANRLSLMGKKVSILDAMRCYAHPPAAETRAVDRHCRHALIASSELLHEDIANRERLLRVLERLQPDCIVHLAANPILSSAERDPVGCRTDILETTRALVEAVRLSGGVRRFVHLSSSMVYGDFEDGLAAEDAPVAPVNAYGRLKLESEDLVVSILSDTSTDWSIVRPMAVYGAGDFYRRVIPLFCAQAEAGEQLSLRAGADMRIDFTHVEDVVDGLIRVAMEPAARGRIFNISCGEARSLLDLAGILQAHFPRLRYELLQDRDVRRPSRGALNIDKARRLLGYSPNVRLEDGIAAYLSHLASGNAGPSRSRLAGEVA